MAVSAVVGLVTAVGAGVAYGFTYAVVLGAFAIGAGLSALSRALIPKPDLGSQMRGTTVTTREPAGPRKLIYGKVRVGGNVVFISHSGTDNKYLHLAVVFATHHITSYEEVWFNDNKIWTSSGDFQDGWESYVTMDTTKLGTAGQSASDVLTPATGWTSEHKLSGIAYLAFKLEWNADRFPQGVPNITAVIRGKRVLDPRTNVTAFSDNPALCVRDYLLEQDYGLGEVNTNIDSTALNAAADLCDEQVSIAGGGTQDRYRCNGVIDTSNQIKSNIEQLLSSMGGKLTYSGGKYFIDGAEYRAPTVTIDETVIISAIKTQTKQSRRDIFNGVKGTFISEEKNYKILDYPAQILKTVAGSFVTDTTYKILFVGDTDFTAIGAASNGVGVEFTATGPGSGTGTASSTIVEDGAQINLDMPLPFVTNNLQAQRLAKIALLKSRQQVVISMTLNLAGLKIKVGDTITVNYDKLGYSGKVFEVIGYELALSNSGEIGVQLECIETAAAIYDWTTADEEDFLSGGELDLYDGRTVDNVTFTASDITEIGLLGPDGGVNSSVQLVWTSPDDAFIEFYKIRYNKNGTTDYFEAETRETRIILSGLEVNQNYDFRIQAQNLIGVSSTGTTVSNFLLEGDDIDPGLPTGLQTTGGIRAITATWTNPSDIDLKQIEVHVVDTNTEPALLATPEAVITGEEYVYPTGQAAAVTKYFFLRSVDFSGNKSDYTAGEEGTSLQVTGDDVGDGEINGKTLALLLNQSASGLANNGEGALVGVNVDGTVNMDSNGFIIYNGNQITIEHDQYNNFTFLTQLAGKRGFIVFDINKTAPFQMSGSFGDLNCAFVHIDSGTFYYDDNSSTRVSFNPNSFTGTQTGTDGSTTAHVVALGVLETSTADNILAGGLYGEPRDLVTEEIPEGAVDITAFASGINPVQVVSTLPATAEQGDMAFLTTDNNLYRYDGTAWTRAIALGDVSGAGDLAALNTVGSSQIDNEAITNAKIAVDAIQEDVIAAGAITETKIGSDAVTTAKIAANAITASEIAAGAVTASEIAAGTITASELAANSVTANAIAAGSVAADEIAAGAITTAKISAGAVTANEIAANTITAGQIAAGAINTDQLAANAVTAAEISVSKLSAISFDIGDITAGTIDASVIKIDDVTLDTNASGQLIISNGGVDTVQVASNAITLSQSQRFTNTTVANSSAYFTHFTSSYFNIDDYTDPVFVRFTSFLYPRASGGGLMVSAYAQANIRTQLLCYNSSNTLLQTLTYTTSNVYSGAATTNGLTFLNRFTISNSSVVKVKARMQFNKAGGTSDQTALVMGDVEFNVLKR